MLAKWPHGLLRKVRKLKQYGQLQELQDIRTTLLLSGIEEKMPTNLSVAAVDEEETPLLYRHVLKQLTMGNRSSTLTSPKTHLWESMQPNNLVDSQNLGL